MELAGFCKAPAIPGGDGQTGRYRGLRHAFPRGFMLEAKASASFKIGHCLDFRRLEPWKKTLQHPRE